MWYLIGSITCVFVVVVVAAIAFVKAGERCDRENQFFAEEKRNYKE